MKLNATMIAVAITLALCIAAQAAHKHKWGATTHSKAHRYSVTTGPDISGNDPGPKYRSQIMQKKGGRYGGND
jgi:hypothetical protein